ncbi:hypothetical protein ACP4OV_026332 [Aristida adscensionis]
MVAAGLALVAIVVSSRRSVSAGHRPHAPKGVSCCCGLGSARATDASAGSQIAMVAATEEEGAAHGRRGFWVVHAGGEATRRQTFFRAE